MIDPIKSVAIYARVSTDKQKVDMQLNELRQFAARSGWTIYQEYIDQNFTGANTNRPAFQEMMDAARKRRFDVLLVWKLDRLSRSLKDLINILDTLGGVIPTFMLKAKSSISVAYSIIGYYLLISACLPTFFRRRASHLWYNISPSS